MWEFQDRHVFFIARPIAGIAGWMCKFIIAKFILSGKTKFKVFTYRVILLPASGRSFTAMRAPMTTKNNLEYPAELALQGQFMNDAAFCAFVRREKRTVWGWRKEGKSPPFFRIGSQIFYKTEDVLAFEIPRCKPRGKTFVKGKKNPV